MLLLLGVTYQIRGQLKKSMKMLRSEGGAASQENFCAIVGKKIQQPFRVWARAQARARAWAWARLSTQF